MISILVPARNEIYLNKTLEDLVLKAEGEIEIIVNLDGYWQIPLITDPHIIYIHRGTPIGMRGGINSCVDIAKGEYLMKLDAHCMMDQGYDVKLIKDYEENTVVVPRRYALDPKKWQIEERKDDKYPIDFMYLDKTLHGIVWNEKNHDPVLKDKLIDETMSNQGSIWFMSKKYFHYLELMDESLYGMFWNEFQEIGLKCWLSGGRVMVNKNTWYAHWHKNEGRGYSLPSQEQINAQKNIDRWLTEKMFSKQIHKLKWLIDRFAPVPTWEKHV
jgi:hypothetical protein